MKKTIILCLGSILMVGVAFAQLPEKLDYGLTLGVGATTGNENGPKTDGLKYLPGPGFRLGGFARYHFNEDWSVQSGLEFATLRSTQKFDGDKSTQSLFSLVLPIQAVYTLPVADRRWMVHAGPAFRINVSGKYKDDFGSTKLQFGPDVGNRRFVPGLQFGVRYKPNSSFDRWFSKKTTLNASFDPLPSSDGGTEVIMGVDGTVLEWDYVTKQYKRKEGYWEIMVRIFINFATKKRNSGPGKR